MENQFFGSMLWKNVRISKFWHLRCRGCQDIIFWVMIKLQLCIKFVAIQEQNESQITSSWWNLVLLTGWSKVSQVLKQTVFYVKEYFLNGWKLWHTWWQRPFNVYLLMRVLQMKQSDLSRLPPKYLRVVHKCRLHSFCYQAI